MDRNSRAAGEPGRWARWGRVPTDQQDCGPTGQLCREASAVPGCWKVVLRAAGTIGAERGEAPFAIGPKSPR